MGKKEEKKKEKDYILPVFVRIFLIIYYIRKYIFHTDATSEFSSAYISQVREHIHGMQDVCD